ncbi:sigma-70 family RNA polymerase sigma factor [Nocardioides sp. MAH-18]|uniref:Sigma-70 family RNA polymerase sigma factor n=1 Tax=Nocardioides agri TaxID=2682843 RepID=A0A6L6XMR2_9ACTN|nr:sigma-70 family RNA polymerase sigma factor [Nocardioides sp. CGMCC 1.13656]MVQ48142.1 sigma-70 family RNA polymerase sigma factor [Nocardioides sp. MAH-18]
MGVAVTTTTTLLRPLAAEELHSSDCGLTRPERAEQTAVLLRAAHETTDPDEALRLRARAVLINRGVAEAVARRYRHRGIADDDLNQVAYEGLTKAIARFDPDLRNDLLTFAVPTIRGELQRYFRDQGWTVRPPRRVQEVQGHANAAIRDLEQSLGREPTEAEVAAELDITVEEYGEAMAALGCFRPASLDLPVGTDTATLGDLLPDEQEEEHDASDARVMLAPVVRRLSERDRRILYLRFFEDRTQAEIGDDLGVTQMQVSRLLSRILEDLRDHLEETG